MKPHGHFAISVEPIYVHTWKGIACFPLSPLRDQANDRPRACNGIEDPRLNHTTFGSFLVLVIKLVCYYLSLFFHGFICKDMQGVHD